MTNFSELIDRDGPVAIVVKERLRPVAGPGSVVFPPTYAGHNGYVIDPLPDGENRCVLNSVQSEANHTEPVFLAAPYSDLVPQITIKAGNARFNILEMAHRLGDASARFSSLETEIDTAFRALANDRNAEPIARLSPMSLVLGVWDSRGTQVKVQRMLGSTIYADDVSPLSRPAQFVPSFSAENVEELESLKKEIEKKSSVVGLAHVPSDGLGGVLVHGQIHRESVLNLIALRQLCAENVERTGHLQRYLLGLALVILTLPRDYNLRSGCQLVRDGKEALASHLVFRDGTEAAFPQDHAAALAFAQQAAKDFDVSSDAGEFDFAIDKARQYIKAKK